MILLIVATIITTNAMMTMHWIGIISGQGIYIKLDPTYLNIKLVGSNNEKDKNSNLSKLQNHQKETHSTIL